MTVKVIQSNCTPLCILPSNKLVAYSLGKLIMFNNGHKEREYRIFNDFKECTLGRFKLLYRLLRLGIRSALAIDEDNILISKSNFIYEFNLSTGHLSHGFNCGPGIRPLIYSQIKDIDSFEDGVYYGGYLSNREKKPVSIYRRVGEDQWEVVYTFPEGTINHIHNIVPDPYRKCVWAFTGDFDKSAGIWKFTNNFQKIEYFAGGNQKYRACVAFALKEGLLYATDAPFADNFIYLMNPITAEVQPLFAIDGSCIYGCIWNKQFVFSSTVEGDGRNTSRAEFYFGRKKGTGIKNDFIHLYIGNPLIGFRETYKLKKDRMPFYTFQFGVFKFPYGVNRGEPLYLQPIATSKNDLKLLELYNVNFQR